MDIQQFSAHFPEKQSPEFVSYVENVALLSSRYIFTHRKGKKQYGYCTHCKAEFETPGIRHNEFYTCPSCKSHCGVRASGKGRKQMVDDAYVVWYEKSLVNPSAITARGVLVVRDYRGDYRKVSTRISVRAEYLFEPGNSIMLDRPYLYYSFSHSEMKNGSSIFPRNSVFSLANGYMANKRKFCSVESIKAAVQGTPFQYSTWESYKNGDMVEFFALFSKYPCIEYLTKLGMRGLVDAKLLGYKTYGMANWRAKNPLKVLKMSKQEMNELRAVGVPVDPWLLYLRHLSKKDGSNLTFTELARIRSEISETWLSDLHRVLARTTLRKAYAYLSKQIGKPDVSGRHSSKGQLLSTWNDYIADCLRLGLDLSREAVLFPSNLYRAHQNTIKQIKVKEDEELRVKFAARAKELVKYRFEALGFLLRPPVDQKELIEEGEALHHCVGTYAPRYAKGETDLLLLRKVDEPDKSFYTMEIRDGKIAQCRGAHNCPPTKEVQAFVNLFTVKKLQTKKQVRAEVTALNQQNRQEVAV
ncbi:PcfJ domain-containing protein [Brevibacillus agri]|uniref:PcfJ domain-containing protein n=1 Tax=Brevibacillus agri TaxID=51101 RepID=UPI001C8ED07B|nr:PcfJ domain-containing protein [Brevibacillus agri]MBY0054113.1 PcfJ domain-containing protein [Brevibacillus agri]